MKLVFLLPLLYVFLCTIAVNKQTKAANPPESYAHFKIDVELCGVLSLTENGFAVAVPKRGMEYQYSLRGRLDASDRPEPNIWILDLDKSKKLQNLAKKLEGKRVIVNGSTTWVRDLLGPESPQANLYLTEYKVQVKSLKAAK